MNRKIIGKHESIDKTIELLEESINKDFALLRQNAGKGQTETVINRKNLEQRINLKAFDLADLRTKKYGDLKRIKGYKDTTPQSIEETEELMALINSV
jgi:hypothetical protein